MLWVVCFQKEKKRTGKYRRATSQKQKELNVTKIKWKRLNTVYQRLCILHMLARFNWAVWILKDTVSSIKGLEMLQFSLFARRYCIKIAVNSNLFKQRGSSCHQLERMLAFNSVFEECFRYWFVPHTQHKLCFLCSSDAQSRMQQHFPESPESLNISTTPLLKISVEISVLWTDLPDTSPAAVANQRIWQYWITQRNLSLLSVHRSPSGPWVGCNSTDSCSK